VLILKFSAKGDVLRTTALLPAIKRKYPKSTITWVTEESSIPLLEGNSLVDRIMAFDASTLAVLGCEHFDVVYVMDKAPAATALGRTVKVEERVGFTCTDWGALGVYSSQSDYALLLGIDDDLKFYKNRKTYQEYMAHALGLDYRRDEMILNLNQAEIDYAQNHLRRLGVIGDRRRPIIGLNTGCTRELDAVVTLLGGPQETKRNAEIKEKGGSLLIADAGTNHNLKQFAAIVSFCDALVTSDTLAMHIGIALKRKIAALFGSTCEQEIDLYDRGVKIFKGLDCSPCYKSRCERQDCMKAISTGEVFEHICNLLG
jgi:heptosyltransferase-2